MDAFHDRLARVALARAGAYGFALAGGYAVQAHGFLDRPSEDVDLFTTMDAEDRFPAAVADVIQAFEDDNLDVETAVQTDGFARLVVHDPQSGQSSQVELGIDWRAHPPTVLNIGPVLHPDDAVANKVTALSPAPRPATISMSMPPSPQIAITAKTYSSWPSNMTPDSIADSSLSR